MPDIKIKAFQGMNNIKDDEDFMSPKGVGRPRIAVNSDLTKQGSWSKRSGQTLIFPLAGAHSLSNGLTSCMLFGGPGKLYRNVQSEKIEICDLDPRVNEDNPLSYVEVDDKVYISNEFFQIIFNPSDNSTETWGIVLPPGPMLLSGAGNLPAGTYNICFTNVSGSEISGSGPITKHVLTAEGGITIVNRPAGAIVWSCEANEPIPFFVGATDRITSIPKIEPLKTLLCVPPFYLSDISYAFGRIWGFVDKILYYSEEYKPGLFKKSFNNFTFGSKGTLIAKVPTGLFVGCEEYTKFLMGTIPDQMKEMDAGSGSVKGTLVYVDRIPELGDVLGTQQKVYVDVPMWRTADGFVLGNASGRLFNLTHNNLRMGRPERGASLYRTVAGFIQILTSSKLGKSGSGTDSTDDETNSIFKNSQILLTNYANKTMASVAGIGDDVSCTVTRAGDLVEP